MKYYRILRELIKRYGSESLVYIDESGFDEVRNCIYGWSKRGKKIYGERQGKRVKKENLVAGRRKKKKDLIAPMIFKGSLNAVGFESWLKKFLIPELERKSVLIMDNAPIHRKKRIQEIVREGGHEVVFLPKYSPDLNDIEHDFSALKRLRMYAEEGTSIDQIIRAYCTG
jgi:putative transposase